MMFICVVHEVEMKYLFIWFWIYISSEHNLIMIHLVAYLPDFPIVFNHKEKYSFFVGCMCCSMLIFLIDSYYFIKFELTDLCSFKNLVFCRCHFFLVYLLLRKLQIGLFIWYLGEQVGIFFSMMMMKGSLHCLNAW